MCIVYQLEIRVKPRGNVERFARVCVDGDILARHKGGRQVDVELLLAGQAQALCSVSSFVLQGHYSHTHQVAAVNSLVALSNDSSHTKEEGTLSRPVSARPAPVVLAGEHNEVRPSLPVLLSGVEDVQDVVGRDVQRLGSGLPNQLVDQSDVSKGASSHYSVIASSRSERIEIPWCQTP